MRNTASLVRRESHQRSAAFSGLHLEGPASGTLAGAAMRTPATKVCMSDKKTAIIT
jgi:hypothetical protein